MTQFMTQKGAVRLFQASREACREGVAEMEARAGIEPAIRVYPERPFSCSGNRELDDDHIVERRAKSVAHLLPVLGAFDCILRVFP